MSENIELCHWIVNMIKYETFCGILKTFLYVGCIYWHLLRYRQGAAQRNNAVDLLYYEQSLCLSCSHTEQQSRVQYEQLWTIRSKTSQNWRAVSHSSCTSHQRPVTFVLLIVLSFFKGLAGTIGHLEAFMLRKKQAWSYSSLLGKNCIGAKASTGSHGRSKEQQMKLD